MKFSDLHDASVEGFCSFSFSFYRSIIPT